MQPALPDNHRDEGDTLRTRSVWGCKVLSQNTVLTSKEWAIAALLSQGSTNAQIATSIQVPEPVVQDYLRSLLQKTGCWNRTEIALWYLRTGVEQERRSSDRRVADSKITDSKIVDSKIADSKIADSKIDDERRMGRRHPPERSPRANEQHDINLDE